MSEQDPRTMSEREQVKWLQEHFVEPTTYVPPPPVELEKWQKQPVPLELKAKLDAEIDLMFLRLRNLKAEKTDQNLAMVIESARRIEALGYRPIILRGGIHLSLQAINNRFSWRQDSDENKTPNGQAVRTEQHVSTNNTSS